MIGKKNARMQTGIRREWSAMPRLRQYGFSLSMCFATMILRLEIKCRQRTIETGEIIAQRHGAEPRVHQFFPEAFLI